MKKTFLALTLFAALPFAAHSAEGISYNYVQAGYATTNAERDADGWSVDGSIAVHPNFHLFGAFSNQEMDHSDYDYDQWRVGVGYNHEMTPKVDLVARVAYEKLAKGSHVDFFGGRKVDFHGWSAEIGARAALAPNFEGYAMAGYENHKYDYKYDYFFDGTDSYFYGRLGAQMKFNKNWGLSGDVKFADGDTQWFVGPRLTW